MGLLDADFIKGQFLFSQYYSFWVLNYTHEMNGIEALNCKIERIVMKIEEQNRIKKKGKFAK